VVTLWLAVNEVTPENGCMRVDLPRPAYVEGEHMPFHSAEAWA